MLLIEISWTDDDGQRVSMDQVENPEGAWPDIAASLNRPGVKSVVIKYEDECDTRFEYRKA